MGFLRCFVGRLNSIFTVDRGYCPSRVCDHNQRRQRPPRSPPAIVDLPHPPDAAVAVASTVIIAFAVSSPVIVASVVAVAVAVAIASAPPPTNRIPSFVKKIFKACRFSRGSSEESAGVELVRESRDGQAQGPQIHVQSSESSAEESRERSAGVELTREVREGQGQELHVLSSESSTEESREGVEQAEITQRPEIERLFAKSSVAVEEAENEIQSPESSIVAEGSSAEESREDVGEIEIACGLEIGTQFAGVVEETEIAHVPEIEDQFTKASIMTEESLSEESKEGMEEAEISHRPDIEVQFTESSVMVEEAKIGHGRGSKAQSLGSTIAAEVSLAEESREEVVEDTELEYDSLRNEVEEGRIEGDAELEEGEIIDSPIAVMEESETNESMRAEVEDEGRIESSWNEVEEVPSAYCSSAISSIPSANPHILSVGTDLETRQESQSSLTGDIAHESCKMWLIRGNKAYAKDSFSEAESFYTRAVNFAFEISPSRRCIQALMLCHSNRAATRMYLGRTRDAIGDCEIVLSIDPNFLRARVRMANCYLALGDIESAMNNYKKCFQLQKDTSSEQNMKILSEASDGLKKAQQVGDCMNRSIELVRKRTKADAMKALGIISEAMSISTHSESLLEIKAECFCLVGKYEGIIQICKHTLSAEKNPIIIGDNGSENQNVSEDKLWRWRVLSMTYFYLGRLEQALELLQKHENLNHLTDKFGSMFPKTSTSLLVVIRGLLGLEAAGNASFHARKFSYAVVHYTAALALSVESRPFAAICLCSRAAAYQELGRVTDAISDCCFAITLDSRNLEAISKRATLYELIRDYEHATIDMKLLISILGNQIKDRGPIFDFSKGLSNIQFDMEQARRRLCTLEEKARKGTRMDLYMILGVARGSSMTDVKNAYKRAALKHHPDKSGMLLIRSENVNEGLWKEIADQRQKYEEEENVLMMKTSNVYAHRSNKGYEQSRNTRYAHQSEPRTCNEGYDYGFNQGDEHNRNSGYAHRNDPSAGFNQGYEYSRNSGCAHRSDPGYAHRSDPGYAHRGDPSAEHSRNSGYAHRGGGPRAGNPGYAHRSDPSASFNQGYEYSRNSGYAHRCDSEYAHRGDSSAEHSRNPGYAHRGGGPRAGNPGYAHKDDHRRRYQQFNYDDLDAQYDQHEQQWDYR